MTSFYEQLKGEADQSMKGYLAYQSQASTLSNDLIRHICTALGIPQGVVQRSKASEEGDPAPGGYIDNDGHYCFTFQISIGRGYAAFHWSIYREGGGWYVKYAEKEQAVPVSREDVSSQALVDYVKTALTETVEDQYHKSRWA